MSIWSNIFWKVKISDSEEKVLPLKANLARFRLYQDSPANMVPVMLTLNHYDPKQDVKRHFLSPYDIFRYRVGDVSDVDKYMFNTDHLQTACAVIFHRSGHVYVGLPTHNDGVKQMIDSISLFHNFEHGSLLCSRSILDSVFSDELFPISPEVAVHLSRYPFSHSTVRYDLLKYLMHDDRELIEANAQLCDAHPEEKGDFDRMFNFSIPKYFTRYRHETCFSLLTMEPSSTNNLHANRGICERNSSQIGEVVR